MLAALLALPATAWATHHERRILLRGRPLTDTEERDARAAGVAHPGKIRILAVPVVPNPLGGLLRWLEERTDLCISRASGLTLRYGIFAVPPGDRDRALLVHEFAHTRQYEECGGVYTFLRQYIGQCLRWGYVDAPLEREAREAAARICRR